MTKHLSLFLTLLCTVPLVAATRDETVRTLAVTGTAEVTVTPDICYLGFGVETEDKHSAVAAYKANASIVEAVLAAVKAQGIEPKDIQTGGLTVSPRYRYEEKTGRQILEGYLVSHSLRVNVRDLGKVSSVLDAAVNAGATRVSNVSFTVENPKKYNQEARIEALKAARVKAEKIAEVTGVKLGRPISISEVEPGSYGGYYAQANVEAQYRGGELGETPLAPGQTKLSHTVNITYEIE